MFGHEASPMASKRGKRIGAGGGRAHRDRGQAHPETVSLSRDGGRSGRKEERKDDGVGARAQTKTVGASPMDCAQADVDVDQLRVG